MGGCFRGKPWRDDNGIENCWVILWGTLTRDAKVTHVNKTKVEFGVKYHAKTYMNCIAWGDEDVSTVMAALETKETVLCAGVWSKRPYTTKDGLQKEWTQLNCDIVIPLSLVKFALKLFQSKGIQKLLASEDAIPDVTEGYQQKKTPSKEQEATREDMSPIDDDADLPF